MRRIILNNGKGEVVVDNDSFKELSGKKWYLVNGYAARPGKMVNGRREPIVWMHRVIAETPKGKETDHINGNRLDNRKENLRVCTATENRRNVGVKKNSLTGIKGVRLETRTGRFTTRIQIGSGRLHIGTFETAKEAAEAYNEAALKYHGEYAKIGIK